MEISETLPGLNAVNMAIIMGDNLRGIAGAAVSVIGMLLPGSIVVMILGILYQSNHDNRSRQQHPDDRSEEHTSELQSHLNLVCRLLLEKKKQYTHISSAVPPI